MQIILASANLKKIQEIRAILNRPDIIGYEDLLGKFEILEGGESFSQNAWIKARAIGERLLDSKEDFLVIADDSGLCVEALGGMPSIYSARFCKIEASLEQLREGRFQVPLKGGDDMANNLKLIGYLQELDKKESPAKFVCVIAAWGMKGGRSIQAEFVGELEGKVIISALNPKAFGYDPLFVPLGYHQTLDQIQEKNSFSHRYTALKQLKNFIQDIL